MFTYSMENRGKTSLYEYLYQCIRNEILSGTLPEGTKLPSRRALAEHLQVSVVTVENAYRQLEAEGYVSVYPRRGAFVALPGEIQCDLNLRADPLLIQPCRTLETPKNNPAPAHAPSNPSRFPAATWARLTRQILSQESLTVPTPNQGLLSLRQAIASSLREYKGMNVSPEQIVVGSGAEYLYLLLAQLLGRSAVFALEDPGYPKIRMVYQSCGAVCLSLPLDPQGIDMDALYFSDATVAHLSPAHHYPTGIVTTIGRRYALLQWAETTGAYLIEDDYDSDFRFSGRPIPTLQSIDRAGRVIYVHTFSQTISSAMRMGYMVLPPELLGRFQEKLGFYACTLPVLEQQVLARFLSEGYYGKHLSRLRKEYRTRRAALLDILHQGPLRGRAAVLGQEAGLHFLLRLDTSLTDRDLQARADARGLRLRFLSELAILPNPAHDHTLIVNDLEYNLDTFQEAAAVLAEILV